ncbi:MAG: hypothetical protein ACLQVY_18465 [Limisphaerales bacterium]
MSAISSVSINVASAISQQTIAALKAQMSRYAQAANGQNNQASADYKALQAAITSGNVSDAQTALARLQRDSQASKSTAGANEGNAPRATSDVNGDIGRIDAKA